MAIFRGSDRLVVEVPPVSPDFCRFVALRLPLSPWWRLVPSGQQILECALPLLEKAVVCTFTFSGSAAPSLGGLAVLAKQLGYRVTGSDANVYPHEHPARAAGHRTDRRLRSSQLDPAPDPGDRQCHEPRQPLRGICAGSQPALYLRPQWLLEHVLKDRWVLAVAGTHGKTTTASMLAWVLEYARLEPGFLIGGVPGNFRSQPVLVPPLLRHRGGRV